MWNEIFSTHSWSSIIQVCEYMHETMKAGDYCLDMYTCGAPRKEIYVCYFFQLNVEYECSLTFCYWLPKNVTCKLQD